MKTLARSVLMGSLLVYAGCGWSNNPFAQWRNEPPATSNFVGEANPLTVDIPVAQPSQEKPVTLGAAVDRTQVAPGQSILLVIRCKTAEPWYIYAADGNQEIGVPTRLELSLPSGLTQQAPWQLPVAQTKRTPLGEVGTYAQDVRFMVPLMVAPSIPPGTLEVQCTFHYQACSDTTCLSPASHKLIIPLTVQSR